MRPIRVLVVDEHPEVRRALNSLLGVSPRLEVLPSAQNFEAGLRFAETLHPDIVVVEPRVRGKRDPAPGVEEMIRGFQARHAATIVLTSYSIEGEREIALNAGARRYLLKDIDAAGLIGEIEAVAAEAGAAQA